jgi:excisionase family DNA binding protein
MQDQATTLAAQSDGGGTADPSQWRATCRQLTLRSALDKRTAGVPTYSVPEAAALLSVSPEHLYRLVRGGRFPCVQMRSGGDHSRWVVPAKALEKLLDDATATGGCVDVATWVADWQAGASGPVGVVR